MKIKFPLSPGEYMFWTGFVYFWVGMYAVFVNKFAPLEYIQMVWILVLALPALIPVPWLMRGSPFWRK